jgi:hypothetical protein
VDSRVARGVSWGCRILNAMFRDAELSFVERVVGCGGGVLRAAGAGGISARGLEAHPTRHG